MKVYEIAPAIRMLFDEATVDPETGEILFDAQAYDEIVSEASEKIANCGRVLREWEAEVDAMKAAEKAIAERRKQAEKKITWLEGLTVAALEALGDKVECPDIRVSTRKSTKVIVDEERLHLDWYKQVISRKPNTEAIKKALKSGVAVEGAELVTCQNLAIK